MLNNLVWVRNAIFDRLAGQEPYRTISLSCLGSLLRKIIHWKIYPRVLPAKRMQQRSIHCFASVGFSPT